MDKFLSCDWGTSSFRLRLIRSEDLAIIAEIKNDHGILGTFKSWQQKGNATDRTLFYTAIIKNQVKLLGQKVDISLTGIPIILSGMASSSIGLVELPYKELPFNIDGSNLEVKVIENKEDSNPLIIISGVRTENDIMRGEETKIVGCAPSLPASEEEQLLILPGTHPKHLVIKNRQVTAFKTFMTGEFFDLLSAKSILSGSVETGGDFKNPENRKSFVKAIEAGRTTDLLHHSFIVRTNQVLHHTPKQQNFYYLSGLLIGAELKGLKPQVPVYLLGGSAHTSLYAQACQTLDIPVAQSIDADHALVKGQQIVLSTFKRSSIN
jgi:2-dehydro-3-deoxygalactonokinase